MLPYVDPENRSVAFSFHQRVVLIGGGGEQKLPVLVGAEPRPAGTELTESKRAQLVLEVGETPEFALQQIPERPGGIFAAGRGDRGKVEIVVIVPTAVVSDSLTQCGIGNGIQRGQQGCDILIRSGLRHRIVQIIRISGMVLGIVRLHRERIDVRLHRVIGIGQCISYEHDHTFIKGCNKLF